jgi:hypothetical protein
MRWCGRLLRSLSLVLQDREGAAPAVRRTPFGSHVRELPVLSEIAVTYRCQNRCTFCYASSPDRGGEVLEMTTDEMKRVLDTIVEDARVPTVSFSDISCDLLELSRRSGRLSTQSNPRPVYNAYWFRVAQKPHLCHTVTALEERPTLFACG